MKITIAYLPHEEEAASRAQELLRPLLAPVKTRYSDRHAPFRHVYIATQGPKQGPQGRGKLDKT